MVRTYRGYVKRKDLGERVGTFYLPENSCTRTGTWSTIVTLFRRKEGGEERRQDQGPVTRRPGLSQSPTRAKDTTSVVRRPECHVWVFTLGQVSPESGRVAEF